MNTLTRKKKTPPAPHTEAAITKSIRDLLNQFRIFHFKHWGGPMGQPGISDIIGCFEGVALFLEIKTQNGRISEQQRQFLTAANNNGALGVVIRSVDDAIELVKGLKDGKDLSYLRNRFRR